MSCWLRQVSDPETDARGHLRQYWPKQLMNNPTSFRACGVWRAGLEAALAAQQ